MNLIVNVVILIYAILIGYFFILEYNVRKKIKNIESNPEFPKILAEKRINAVKKWSVAYRLGLSKTNFFLVPTNIILALISVLAFSHTVDSNLESKRISLEANKINKEIADLEYENAQPFVAIIGGNMDGARVKIKNAGGGSAKDLFFLKHYLNSSGTSIYVLTRERDVVLALIPGQEAEINLNQNFMDIYRENQILDKIPCITSSIFLDKNRWVAAFYKNLRGDIFVSKFLGSDSAYDNSIDFKKLSGCIKS